MATFKVVFLDIDGTILRPDHSYSENTKKAISQLQEQGIEVFLATGRPIHEIKELGKELNIDSFIGYNGAHAIYNEETIVDETMKKDIVEQFIEVSMAKQHELVMYTNGTNVLTQIDSPISKQFVDTFQMHHNAKFSPDVIDKILGMTVMNLQEGDESLYESFDENIRLARVNVDGVRHAYDVLRLDVNKGEAIKKALDVLNIPREQSIAFGDGLNDKEMLQTVGESFAMGNASPELFQYAKHKTTTVEEDGIYVGLKKLGLVE